MVYLVFVILSASIGLTTSDDEDLSAFDPGDNTGFYTNRLRRPKFVDVYTNYPDRKEVEGSFYKNYNLRNKNVHIDRKDKFNFQNIDVVLSPQSTDVLESEHGLVESNFEDKRLENLEDEYEYTDRNNYYYPHSAHLNTKNIYQTPMSKKKNKFAQNENKNNFVFLQSQIAIPDSENFGSFYASTGFNSEYDPSLDARPDFMTKNGNFSGKLQYFNDNIDGDDNITDFSHVQKIPSFNKRSTTVSPETSASDSKKYEEINLAERDKMKPNDFKTTDTRKRIGDLLKKYVTQLFIEKYTDKREGEKKPFLENSKNVGNTNRHTLARNTTTQQKKHKIDQESKLFSTDTLWDLKNKTITKIKNLFSIFTVIKFNNTECNATNWAGTWQGFCYTPEECDRLNGTALGNCASGFGVCCVFRGSCGDSSNMNCTYFKSPNYPDFYPSNGDIITPTTTTVGPTSPFPTPDPRLHWYYYNRGNGDDELDILLKGRQTSDSTSCIFSVYKSDPDVKYMRIDFIDLDLAGPTNGTCTTERLVISRQNANDRIPVICGYNTGQHVYVDVSQLSAPLQLMVLSTTGARKRFKLRICQYTDSCGTPQSNCLQYFTGVTGVIESFNYDQAAMFNRSVPGYFNNLNYAICIRREAGYCSITYTNVRNGQTNPFQLVNRLPSGQLTVPIGQAGVDIINCPDDYIIIDGTRLCGDRLNDGSTASNFSVNVPVMDTSAGPIVINVRTNNNVTGLGFKLYYTQNPCPTPTT